MGNKQSQLTEEELEDYKELTYLTRKEILHTFRRFKELDPRAVNRNKEVRLPASKIQNIPELKNNPFAERICKVFDSEGDGHLSFEDFLDMASVFSESAPLKTKSDYAFRIYDFNEDGCLTGEDICQMVELMTCRSQEKLTEQESEDLVKKIMDEADLDRDETLSPAEFEHVLRKSPDFMHTFTFRL